MRCRPSIVLTGVVAASITLPAAGSARARVVHASPDAPAVDVLVDGAPAFTDLAFTGVSGYAALDAGTYNVQVVPAGASEPVVIEADLALDPDTSYTVLAVNVLDEIEPLVLVDDNTQMPDMARVRFVHASPNAPAVDIAVANGGPVLFGGVEFKGIGEYLAVEPGTYDLEARLAGTPTVVLDVPNVALRGGAVYTVYAMGLVAGMPELQAVVSVDAACDPRVRVVHASPDAPAVDVRVDGATAFSGIGFTNVSHYAALPSGTYNVQVSPAGMMDPVVIDADLALAPGTDYSVLAVGTLDAIEPLVLIDDNRLSGDAARVRFVHASPNAPAVDIALAGGPVLFGNVQFKETGDYIEVSPGTYDLEARLAGSTTVVLEIPAVALEPNAVYTAYAMGLVGGVPALQAVLSVDARCRPYDLDCDQLVGMPELMAVLNTWGPCGDCPADVNGDGSVDFGDLLIVLTNWGPCLG